MQSILEPLHSHWLPDEPQFQTDSWTGYLILIAPVMRCCRNEILMYDRSVTATREAVLWHTHVFWLKTHTHPTLNTTKWLINVIIITHAKNSKLTQANIFDTPPLIPLNHSFLLCWVYSNSPRRGSTMMCEPNIIGVHPLWYLLLQDPQSQ